MNDARVLLVSPLGRGGIDSYVRHQRTYLDGRFDVSVFGKYAAPDGTARARRLRSLAATVRPAAAFPFRRRPDLVHVHTSHRFSFYRSAYYVLFADRVWDCPVVLHVHGSSFDEFLATDSAAVRRLQSLAFAASDRVVVLSAYWRDRLAGRVAPAELRVLPNAVEPDGYDPRYGADPPHLVFLSTCIERKGLPELVAALDALADRGLDFRATLAGTGPLADRAESLAARRPAVEYRGYVDEADKRDLLSAGSVYVLPTRAEGLPIAMLEGMAGGNAVVATGVGAIPEVLGDGTTREDGSAGDDGDASVSRRDPRHVPGGVLVEPGDAEGLADALASLLSAPGRVERAARRNRRLVRERYAWPAVADRLAALYGELLDG